MLENEDTAGKHAISAETGKEGAESEEFITDNSAPKLTVNYEGVLNIMDKDSAIWNINETLHNNEGKVTSSQNQIFCGKENGISICIEEDNIVPEDIEIKLYRMSYGRKGQWEQEEVSESDINKKIIRLKENQQSQGIFLSFLPEKPPFHGCLLSVFGQRKSRRLFVKVCGYADC